MTGLRRNRINGLPFLTGVLILLGAGPAPVQAWDWRSHIHIGPDPYPTPEGPNAPPFYQRMPPDWGPYPDSWWHWPSLREALDQYGWFGRRACKNPPVPVVAGPVADVPPLPVAPPEVAPQSGSPDAALIRVLVPPDARIWIDDQPTTQTGRERRFTTPPLKEGNSFAYEIRARWREESKEVRRSRVIRVYPGDRLTVDFFTLEPENGP
jgi:uncharacterized protein (TIGR03000 family)